MARRRTSAPLLPLLLAASIPMMLFAGWAAYNSANEHRQAALSFARQTVARVGERITANMSTQTRVAETLAQAASLPSIDLSAFSGEARRVQAVHPLWYTVELDDPGGNQVVNVLRPLGSPLGATADRSAINEVVNDRRPVIGGIGPVGSVSGKSLVALHVPVMRDGTLLRPRRTSQPQFRHPAGWCRRHRAPAPR